MHRSLVLLAVGVLASTACSGATTEPEAESPPTTVADEPIAADAGSDDAALSVTDGTDSVDVVEQWSVTIDVTADGFDGPGVDASVGWTGDPNDVVPDGPFGEFASCSGLRGAVGAYSVFVSGAGEPSSVGVWTSSRVTGAGIYDAEVRIERDGSAPLSASGTMTILDGFQQGEFLAFGAGGGRIEGTFSCSGTEPGAPLRASAGGAVEAFAVLRDGQEERIVGLATEAGERATCDPVGDPILRVEGDATVGAITALEIGGGPDASASLRIAGTTYEFDRVDVQLDPAAETAGVFSAVSGDGLAVDGAFRCT